MVMKCEDVKVVWLGLCVLHGLGALNTFHEFDYEVIRETLMQFLPLYRGEPHNMTPMVETIQFLTVLACMSFKATMDGEEQITELSCWMRWEDIIPTAYYAPNPNCNFEDDLRSMCWAKLAYCKDIVLKSTTNLDTLLADVHPNADYIRANLRAVRYIFQRLELSITWLIKEKEESEPV